MKGKLKYTVLRWLVGSLATTLFLCVVAGCQPVFLSKEVYECAYKDNLLPPAFDNCNGPVKGTLVQAPKMPATVDFPERRQRHMTLQEAIAHALENGLPSTRSAEGRADTNLANFAGPGSLNNQTDRIRVIALNPAISSAAMEASMARFDAVWVTGMNWTNTDNLQQGLSSFNNGHGANFNSSIVKAFADGSVANFSLIANYTNLNTPPTGLFDVLNPQYTIRPSFGYEAPLWRDSGVAINQLISRISPITGQFLSGNNVAGLGYNAHQSQVSSFLNGPTEGILISKLRFDQSRAEFERNVQAMVKNVEIAYWNLYSKYGQLYSFEENLRILRRAFQENYIKHQVGTLTPYKYRQALGQFEEFRANRIQALQEVLDAERNLRLYIGLPTEDGERLVPITPPTLAEFKPDWDLSVQDTLNLRPELVLARENLRYHEYLLALQKNNLKPDLRFFARYEPVGFGSTLTGSGTFIDGTGTERPTNAFSSLKSLAFADYQLGLYLNVPIGQRYEHAAIRAARLQLAQSYYFLLDQEAKAVAYLTEQYQEINHWYRRIEAHRSERFAYAEALRKYDELIQAGGGAKDESPTYGSLTFLSIQRSYAAALVKEYTAVAEYNNALARMEWAKGATLRYNNVYISEGQLPECVQENAAQYERNRSREIALRQRPDSLWPEYYPGRFVADREVDVPHELPPVEVINETRLPVMRENQSPVKLLRENKAPVIPGQIQPVKGTSPFTPDLPDATFTPKPGTEQKPTEIQPVFVPAGRPTEVQSSDAPPAPVPFEQPIALPVGRPSDTVMPKMKPVVEPKSRPIEAPSPLPIRQPAPLPTLEVGPMPISLLPAPRTELGSVGYVTTETSRGLAFLAGPETGAREASPPNVFSPVRGPSPQVIDFMNPR